MTLAQKNFCHGSQRRAIGEHGKPRPQGIALTTVRCAFCGRMVMVKRDGMLRNHKGTK